MSYYLKHYNNNLWCGEFSLFGGEVLHAVSARLGGVSRPPYSSLNLAFHVGDDADAVRQNRFLLAAALGFDPKKIVSPKQVHGENILRVTANDAGCGAADYESAPDDTDALITNEANLPLMLCFADCAPILFFDAENMAIGIAHGGWKGTAKKIAAKTLAKMSETFGTDPAECLAAIGPSIGPESCEVGEDVRAAFAESFGDTKNIILERGGKKYLDLWAANERQLTEAGMRSENIDCARVSTAEENKWYFSYRADGGTTGRIAAVMMLRGV